MTSRARVLLANFIPSFLGNVVDQTKSVSPMAPVINIEIYEALNTIGSWKNPGKDGFHAQFFSKYIGG